MAEPYQPISVNTGSAQSAIQGTPNVTPALDGLMSSIKEGFISADDIRKRVQSGPLEAATRQQDLADVQQVRPLQREAAVTQLQNVQAKQQFEAEALPVLNDIAREKIKTEYQDVLQHGVPSMVMAVFQKTVPGFIPFDPKKLYGPDGTQNTSYMLDLAGKAIDKAEKIKQAHQFTEKAAFTNVTAEGAKTVDTGLLNVATGEKGIQTRTTTEAAPTGKNIVDIKSERVNTATGQKEFTVQRFDKDTGQLLGDAKVVGAEPLKLTQEQANALQFSDRMGFNNQIVDSLVTKGFDPTAFKNTAQSFLFNRWQSEPLQSYTAAKDNWITAALRKESGAAISASEYTMANKEYFPRDGDSAATVKQKAALRELAEEDIRLNSPTGGFWNPGGGRKTPAGNPVTPVSHLTGASPAAPVATPVAAAANIPTVQTPEEASALPSTIQFFKTPTGQTKLNPNYIP